MIHGHTLGFVSGQRVAMIDVRIVLERQFDSPGAIVQPHLEDRLFAGARHPLHGAKLAVADSVGGRIAGADQPIPDGVVA